MKAIDLTQRPLSTILTDANLFSTQNLGNDAEYWELTPITTELSHPVCLPRKRICNSIEVHDFDRTAYPNWLYYSCIARNRRLTRISFWCLLALRHWTKVLCLQPKVYSGLDALGRRQEEEKQKQKD